MTEDQLEQEALGWLADVGWQRRYGPDLAPDGATPERSDYIISSMSATLVDTTLSFSAATHQQRWRRPSA